MSGVHRIGVGTGSPEGGNSAYVLPDRGVVVDPGPPTDSAWSDLRNGIEAAGIGVDDVGVVVATHWHADHAGLGPRLADTAEADLHMSTTDATLVSEYATARERRIDCDRRRLAEWGVPRSVVEAVIGGDTPSPMPDEYPVRHLSGGDTVMGLEVVDTPGHTSGHVSLLDHDSGALFLGDAVLQRYTPNVGGGDTRMDRPLSSYLDSLDRIETAAANQFDGEVSAHPGHGTELPLGDRIGEIRHHHAERASRVLKSVHGRDGGGSSESVSGAGESTVTPWDVAVDLFGEMQGVHAKMGAGEAASHLVELAAAGYVDRVDTAGDVDRVDESPVTFTESVESNWDEISIDVIANDVLSF